MNKRTEIINYRLKKAHEELNNAKLSLDNELYSSSLSASYYAIFHAARALLAAESIVSKKHSSVIYLFSEHFIKPGIVNKNIVKSLVLHLKCELKVIMRIYSILTIKM